MLNKVIMIGRIAKDPQLRYTVNKKPVCSFNFCVPRDFSKEADFFSVYTWNKTAENVHKYCKKGDIVSLVGRLAQRKWTDKQGNRHYTVDINADSVGFINLSKNKTTEDDFPDIAPEYTPEEGFGELMDALDEELPY